jgi:hypothetical protein
MSIAFCTTCGQRRDGDARFCKKCGTEFRDGTAAGLLADDRTPTGPPAFPPPPPPAPVPPPADTAWSVPAGTWSVPASTEPPPPAAPAEPYPGQRPPSGGRKTLFIVAGVIVVLLAAGGGAYALVQPGKGKPAAGSSRSGPTDNVVVATTAPPAPSPSPTPSVTPSASPTQPGPVTVAAGVAADPAQSQVSAFLDRYFTAVNKRDYTAYNSLLDPTEQQNDSKSSFESGYATTTDSAERLTGLAGTGGDMAATVSFTSHQDAADSVNDSSCTDWTITLYLVPAGNSYEITAPPSSYRSSHADCPAG